MHLLQPLPPYSFSHSMKRLTDMPEQVVVQTEQGGVYTRALDQGGRLGLVRVWEAEEGLVAAIEGDLDHQQALQQVRRAFSLDLDLLPFYRHVEQADSTLSALVQRYRGARPIRAMDLWESLAWTIIGQQVNVAFAYKQKEALVRVCGRSYNGRLAFPGPEAVAALPYEALQAQQYPRKKAEYVIDLARAVAAGSLDLEAQVAQPFDQAVASLVRLRGVGRWTAECLLMDAGSPDAFPADDIGIRNAVRLFYALDRQPTEAEVRERGDAWSPYSALACYYLWLGLRSEG